MAYAPTTWVEKVTKVGPTNMNKLELGLQAAAAVADAALPTPAGVDGQFLQRVGGLWVPHTLVAADMPSSIPYSKLSLASSIVTGDIVDGTILNADINAAAAIAGSKLATGLSGPPGTELAYAEFTVNVTANNVAEAAATQVVSAGAFAFDGATAVIIEFFAPALAPGAALTGGINLWDGATDLGRLFDAVTVQLTTDVPGALMRRKLTPSNASHTYSIRVWTTTVSNFNVLAGAGGAGVKLPGYIRITKA